MLQRPCSYEPMDNTAVDALFIVPGIIKSYSYRLVPYILAENPDIDTNSAICSEQLMSGQQVGNIYIMIFPL